MKFYIAEAENYRAVSDWLEERKEGRVGLSFRVSTLLLALDLLKARGSWEKT